MTSINYQPLLNSSTNLKILLQNQNADGTISSLFSGSEPEDVLAAKAIFNQQPGSDGEVNGPASATDNAVARFDGTTGKLIQNSVVTIADTTGDIAGATSLTSPASTNLTLAGGAGNSSIILTPAGTGGVGIGATTPLGKLEIRQSGGADVYISSSGGNYKRVIFYDYNASPTQNSWELAQSEVGNALGIYPSTAAGGTTFDTAKGMTFLTTGNVLIGTTSDTGLTGSGGLKINSSTAGSSGAGALVVQGGLATGAASYIGGALTATGANIFNAASNALKLGASGSGGGNGIQLILDGTDAANNGVMIEFRRNTSTIFYIGNGANAVGGSYLYDVNDAVVRSNKGFSVYCSTIGNAFHLAETTGAATFAGDVTANGTLTNTAAQLGTFTSTTANGTSGEGVFSVVGSNNNTNIAYGINRAPGIAICNTSGIANSYGGISFQDGGGNATSSIFGIFENDANNTGSLQFATRPSGGSLTTALTLASTGAATFAGAVTMGGWPIIGNDGNATYVLQSAATITAYTGGGSVGTLTNAPSAGNPTKWITINDNGTLRQIPTWN